MFARPCGKIPAEGPIKADAPGIVPPQREKMKTEMEALIYHFKIFTEGFAPPPGEVYQRIESPRGRAGILRGQRRLAEALPREGARAILRESAGVAASWPKEAWWPT